MTHILFYHNYIHPIALSFYLNIVNMIIIYFILVYVSINVYLENSWSISSCVWPTIRKLSLIFLNIPSSTRRHKKAITNLWEKKNISKNRNQLFLWSNNNVSLLKYISWDAVGRKVQLRIILKWSTTHYPIKFKRSDFLWSIIIFL